MIKRRVAFSSAAANWISSLKAKQRKSEAAFIHRRVFWFSGIVPEVSIDPVKAVEDALLEFSDKKDLFLAYMSSMLVGDQGTAVWMRWSKWLIRKYPSAKCFSVSGETVTTPDVNIVTEKGFPFLITPFSYNQKYNLLKNKYLFIKHLCFCLFTWSSTFPSWYRCRKKERWWQLFSVSIAIKQKKKLKKQNKPNKCLCLFFNAGKFLPPLEKGKKTPSLIAHDI